MLHDILQFIQDPQNAFKAESLISLKLSVVPTLLAILIAIPVGVLVAQRPFFAFLAINTSGLARAIPTLAFLAAALAVFNRIGFVPAAVALTLLGVPPILLNTVAGLRGIDPAATDAARGMGMTTGQVLRRIQIPLILPVIAAGVRTSAVQIISTTPLAALIGAGGWGDYILGGIDLGEQGRAELLLGGFCVAALALIAELALAATQRALTPVGIRVSEAPLEVAAQPEAVAAQVPEPMAHA